MTKDITTLIAEARAAGEGRTPGPWEADIGHTTYGTDRVDEVADVIGAVNDPMKRCRIRELRAMEGNMPERKRVDARFIAFWGSHAETLLDTLQSQATRIAEMEAENERLQADKVRLDFLDEANVRLNKQVGTKYGWEIIFNHNVNRLMSGRPQQHMAIDLNGARAHGYKSCRDAIDVKIKDIEVRRAALNTEEA
ncbi:MAG: hypothetical protein AAGJ50_10645 [Pseudomonadota bacterium]